MISWIMKHYSLSWCSLEPVILLFFHDGLPWLLIRRPELPLKARTNSDHPIDPVISSVNNYGNDEKDKAVNLSCYFENSETDGVVYL